MKSLPPRFVLITLAVALVASLAVLWRPPTANAQTTQEAFIAKIDYPAQQDQARTLVPASVTMGQAILESGWGRSSLAAKYNNYFGIKCTSTPSPHQSGCVTLTTTEYVGSPATPVQVKARFRTYSSIYKSFADHSRLLTSLSRYRPAFAYTTDPENFIKAVAKGGYATDPSYAKSVIWIMNRYDLYQYDLTPDEPKRVATSAQRQAFFKRISATAQKIQIDSTFIPASVLMAQAAKQTNYGKTDLFRNTNNYFGLRCTSTPSPYQKGCYTVTRMINGRVVQASYRTYSGMAASFADISRTYTYGSRYTRLPSYRKAPEGFLKTVALAGFGGGSSYFTKVVPIMRTYRLKKYDMPYITLRVGSTGFRVVALKRLLQAEGLDVGLTSRYDTRTSEAVKIFQRRIGLPASGVANPATLRSFTWRFYLNRSTKRVAALQVLLTGKGYYTKTTGFFNSTTARNVTKFNSRTYGPSGSSVTLTTWGKLFS